MIRQYQHRLKGMTYILGAHCSDGVVLVGDRKVMLGGGAKHEYEDKLFSNPIAPWMVVGSSGTTGLFEKFRERLGAYIATPAYDGDMITLTTQIESITNELNTTYQERLEGEVFNVLLGIKSTTGATLRYIYPFGFAEGVRNYKAIGHGEPYGSFFLKRWWREDMTMLEVAELGFFIIKYIEDFQLDNTVGVGNGYPQVWLIPHERPKSKVPSKQTQSIDPHNPSLDEMVAMKKRVLKRLTKFKKVSWSS
jgi:20S proteasome alpha/beta subunit